MKQHTITEWLLNDFSSGTADGPRIVVAKKRSGRITVEAPADFLAEIDAHSDAIETRLSRIEGRAARAARALVARALTLEPGVIRIESADEQGDAELTDAGTAAGFRLMVVARARNILSDREREALGRFATLMFTRSPKIAAVIGEIATTYQLAMASALRRSPLPPSAQRAINDRLLEVGVPAERALSQVRQIGTFVADGNWWIVRAREEQQFVLGDTPLAAAVALGHAEEFVPLGGPDTYVLAMPLHPKVALLVTPTPVVPVGGPEFDPVDAINRLSWMWAQTSVIAQTREALDQVSERLKPDERVQALMPPIDLRRIAVAAGGDMAKALVPIEHNLENNADCLEARRHRLDAIELAIMATG